MINLITSTLIGSPFTHYSFVQVAFVVAHRRQSSVTNPHQPTNQPIKNCVVALSAQQAGMFEGVRIISREWIKFSRLSILASFTPPCPPRFVCLCSGCFFHSVALVLFRFLFFVLHRYSSRASEKSISSIQQVATLVRSGISKSLIGTPIER